MLGYSSQLYPNYRHFFPKRHSALPNQSRNKDSTCIANPECRDSRASWFIGLHRPWIRERSFRFFKIPVIRTCWHAGRIYLAFHIAANDIFRNHNPPQIFL